MLSLFGLWLVYLRKSEVATYLERKSNEKEKTFISDNLPAAYLVFSLNIPLDIFPDIYDGAELRISINNETPFGKDRNYYRTIIINVPRISNILTKTGSFLKTGFYPGLKREDLDKFIDGNFLNHIWYSQNGVSFPVVLDIANERISGNDLSKKPINVTIIGKTKTYTFGFKINDLPFKDKAGFIYNLMENKSNYSTAVQNIIDNKVIPYLDFVKNPLMDNNGVSLPVCEIQSQIKSGIETKLFRIKINLPVSATLSNITYKIGTGVDIVKPFGNVKYNPNYNVYLANKSANSGNDLYFTDLQTTGVLKIPIASSASSITGTVNYKIGSITKTISFSI